MQELFIGVDFHKKSSYVTGISPKGKVVLRRQISNDKENWERLLNELPAQSKKAIGN